MAVRGHDAIYSDLLVSADCQCPPHREALSAVVSDAHKRPGGWGSALIITGSRHSRH